MVSLSRKVNLWRAADEAKRVKATAARTGRTGQVVRSTVPVGDVDVPVVEGVASAVDAVAALPVVEAGVADALTEAYEAGVRVDEAQDDASAAAQAAADAQSTADGKNSRRRGVAEPAPPEGGWVQGDQWVRDQNRDGVLVPVQVFVWDGDGFVPEQIIADDILVYGEDGTVRITKGGVTADAIAVGALDFVVARGAQLYGGYIEAPHIASSDKLGSGANALTDPTFLSAVNTAWVASGHLGDAAAVSTDTHTWDQTVTRESFLSNPAVPMRLTGSGVSTLSLTPAARKCGSLLFANYSWKPSNRTLNNPYTYPNPHSHVVPPMTGAIAYEWATSKAPSLATPTARTTYLTNSAIVPVGAGERWNVRVGFTKLDIDAVPLVNLRVEIINSTTSAVLWFYDLVDAEKRVGAINTWYEATTAQNVKVRIRAVYTAAGGAAVRRLNSGAYSRKYVNGVMETNWSVPADKNYHAYGGYPLAAPSGGIGGAAGAAGIPPANIKLRAELQLTMLLAVFAKVQPQRGLQLTETNGLEMFDSMGARTARLDGEENYFTGRFGSSESGARWEIEGDSINLFDEYGAAIGVMKRSGPGVTTNFNVFALKSQLDAWAPIDGTHAWVTAEGREYVRAGGTWKISHEDTGWVDLTSSITSTWRKVCRARRKGGSIEILFDGGGGSVPAGNTTLGTLPALWAPLISPNRRGAGYFSGGYQGVFYIAPNGEFGVSQQTGAARTNLQGHLIFGAD